MSTLAKDKRKRIRGERLNFLVWHVALLAAKERLSAACVINNHCGPLRFFFSPLRSFTVIFGPLPSFAVLFGPLRCLVRPELKLKLRNEAVLKATTQEI